MLLLKGGRANVKSEKRSKIFLNVGTYAVSTEGYIQKCGMRYKQSVAELRNSGKEVIHQ